MLSTLQSVGTKRKKVTITESNYNYLRSFGTRNNKTMIETIDMLLNNIMCVDDKKTYIDDILHRYAKISRYDLDADKIYKVNKRITISGTKLYEIALQRSMISNYRDLEIEIVINAIITYAFENQNIWYCELRKSKQEKCTIKVSSPIKRELINLSNQIDKSLCRTASYIINNHAASYQVTKDNLFKTDLTEDLQISKESYDKLEKLSNEQNYDVNTFFNSFISYFLLKMLIVK